MTAHALYPRFAEARLADALGDNPVVLIHGPRQSGKTTLAQMVGNRRSYSYFSFDDDILRTVASSRGSHHARRSSVVRFRTSLRLQEGTRRQASEMACRR